MNAAASIRWRHSRQGRREFTRAWRAPRSPRSDSRPPSRTASRSRARKSLKSSTAPKASLVGLRWTEALANYGATMAFIGFGVWFYTQASGYHRNEFSSELALTIGGGA